MADVERRHADAAAWSARARERTAERQDERERVQASLDLGCGRCGGTLEPTRRVALLATESPDLAVRDEDFAAGRRSTVSYDEFVCAGCGAVQLFKPGRPGG